MKTFRSILNKISAFLFLTALIASRLRNIPVLFASSLFNLISLSAYLIGYISWYVSALLHTDHPRKKNHWFGFATFKEQYELAALLGTVATIMMVASIMIPLLVIPGAWLYALSNCMWSISEYHKKENPPPDDETYSRERQTLFFRYTMLLATSSALTALAVSVSLLFPASAFILIPATTIAVAGLAIPSLYYWGKSTFGNFLTPTSPDSYLRLSKELSPTDQKPYTAAPRQPIPAPKSSLAGTKNNPSFFHEIRQKQPIELDLPPQMNLGIVGP